MSTVQEAQASVQVPPSAQAVKARGYWELIWIRLRRDKVAIAGGIFIIFMFLAAFVGAPIAAHLLGHGPNDQFFDAVDANSFLPVGPMTHVKTPDGGTTLFILGADSTIGRDLFLRLLYGAQTSLEVAVFATFFIVFLGVLMGALAGYFRGGVDTIISRVTEIFMCFPALLFIIAISATAGQQLNAITFGFLAPGVFTLMLIFTLFGWFYPRRIVRGQVLSLREKEFVEAAQDDGCVRLADHPVASGPAPRRPGDRVLDAHHRHQHHRRGRPLVSRARHPGADVQLGEHPLAGAAVLPHPAQSHDLAGPADLARDARVQPARRRAPGRVRSA